MFTNCLQRHSARGVSTCVRSSTSSIHSNLATRVPIASFTTGPRLTTNKRNLHLGVNPTPEPDIPFGKPPSDPKGHTGIVSNWVHSLNLNDVESNIIERAKHIILDGVACALVAAQLPESQVAAKSVFSMESPGRCTVIGWDKRVGPLPAALLNSTFIQGFEMDDVHREAPWHANSIILPALLASIEHAGDDVPRYIPQTGASFLTSAIVGFELGGRIGRSLNGPEMLSRGWHSGAVFGPAAAAAAVSRQLGMSPQQTEDAMGTACTQACGLMSAQYEAMAKRMQHGFASRNGLFAALSARENYTGIDKVFERPYGGFLAAFGGGASSNTLDNLNVLTQDLGVDWTSLEGICIKPHSSMVGTHGAIDCVQKMQDRFGDELTDFSSIKSIKVELSKAWYHHSGQDVEKPITVIGAQMSTKYCVAAQLVNGSVLPKQFTEEKLNRDIIWDLVEKVSCEHNPEFDNQPRPANPTRVTFEFEDGTTLVDEVRGPRTTMNPLTNEEIVEKWREAAASCIDSTRMSTIEDMVLNIERLDSVTPLIQALSSRTKCPI